MVSFFLVSTSASSFLSNRPPSRVLQRVSPQSIFEAFQAQRHPVTSSDEVAAVRRLGFDVDPLSPQQLKASYNRNALNDLWH
jgi:hypothetical protein